MKIKSFCYFWNTPSKHLLVFKTSSRRLQDISWRRLQYVFSVTIFRLPRRLKDVLKTSPKKTKNCYAEDILKTCLEDVLKTSPKKTKNCYAEELLKTCLEDLLKTCLEDVLKTSWKRLEDVLKMSWRRFCKTSWRRLEDILKTSWQNVLKTSWRRMTKTIILVLIKTSLRSLLKTYEYSEYVCLDQDVLKMSSEDEDKRCLQDVFRTSSSKRMFAGHWLL